MQICTTQTGFSDSCGVELSMCAVMQWNMISLVCNQKWVSIFHYPNKFSGNEIMTVWMNSFLVGQQILQGTVNSVRSCLHDWRLCVFLHMCIYVHMWMNVQQFVHTSKRNSFTEATSIPTSTQTRWKCSILQETTYTLIRMHVLECKIWTW